VMAAISTMAFPPTHKTLGLAFTVHACYFMLAIEESKHYFRSCLLIHMEAA
jgi:hypothetical protein